MTTAAEKNLFTPEQNTMMSRELKAKYANALGDRYFVVDGKLSGKILNTIVTLRNDSGKFYYPVECRINLDDQDISVNDARDLLLDFTDAYFEEYLMSDPDTFLTIDWSNYECDGIEFQMKGQILNQYLESAADEILKGSNATLN